MNVEKVLYYESAELLYNVLFPKEEKKDKVLSLEKAIYEANDGSIIFEKERLPELELLDSMDANIIFFSDRVVKPYVKLPKYFTINYARLFRYTIYLAYYIYKKKTTKNYSYFLLEKDIKDFCEKLVLLYKEFYEKSEELSEISEFDPSHPVVEKYLISQIMPFVMLFSRPDIIFFFQSKDPKKDEELLKEEYNVENISKLITSARNVIKKSSQIVTSEGNLDAILEKYSFVNFRYQGEFIKIEEIPRSFQLLSSLLRIIYILKKELKENYKDFIYKVSFCAFLSSYNPFFHKIKYLFDKKKEKKHLQIPDIGNIFLFRMINIILSYLKNRNTIVEILGGRDLHIHAIATFEEIKKEYKNLYVNPILPFDTRVVELLQIEKFSKLSENYLRTYSLENEKVKVVLYKLFLEKYFNIKITTWKKLYEPDPRQLFSDVMFYEKISLQCESNKNHFNTVFKFDASKDISKYQKYGDKKEVILLYGRFSDYKGINSYRKVTNHSEIYEYSFEKILPPPTEPKESKKVSNRKSDSERIVKRENLIEISFIGKEYIIKQIETNKLLKSLIINSLKLESTMEGEVTENENLNGINFDAIDESIYNDIVNSIEERDVGSSNDIFEKLLILKEEENKLLKELNSKMERLIELIKK